ncbi:RNA recognition motif domain-containing protein [Agarivorans aestuarii]|uniref:RNA recognition motif domain-containing protein n=1 Tax=Agarivorans aestuarii TaxID=1563703 RepID=UPI001C804C9F|nr:RNA-binding protein [Agarivorans aestuarii]
MKILVRNLARSITEADLLALFESHGAVESCDLVLDNETGKSKGFGFISMLDETQAQAAIAALNSTKQAGNKIRVKFAEEKAESDDQAIWPESE